MAPTNPVGTSSRAALLGVAAAVTVAACGPTAATPREDLPVSLTSLNDERDAERFLEAFRRSTPSAVDIPDWLVLDTVNGLCTAIDDGVDPEEMWDFLVDNLGIDVAASVAAGAVTSICPRNGEAILSGVGR